MRLNSMLSSSPRTYASITLPFALCASLLAACSDGDPNLTQQGPDESATGGAATGGQAPGVGGSTAGSGGGEVTATGGVGAQPSTGGADPVGTGGAVTNTGGVIISSGGVFGTGGTPVETVSCDGEFPTQDVAGATHSLAVDATTSWGLLPHFWNTFGTGHLGLYLREDRGWGELLKQHTIDGIETLGLNSLRQHGLFHDDIGIYHEEDDVPVYDFEKSDQIFDFFVEQGIEPIIELAPMPSDLAADPSYTVFDWNMVVSPPKDYQRWQELVFTFVQHSIDRYGVDVVSKWYFEVWNEPECCNNKFWGGSLDEYFELYDHSAAGVRAALPDGRVGGPVTSQPAELIGLSGAGVAFLDHVTTDNYITPGSPGILDFFSFHSWSFVGGSVGGYFLGLDLLDSYGLNDTRIAVTEFGPTWEFGLVEEPQEMSQGAAFVAQTYSDISRRVVQEGRRFPITYSWWVLSDVFEEGLYFEDDPFIGCMGLTTRENIHKPAYNAYKFLNQMGTEQLPFAIEGPGHVGGMATRDAEGGIQVIVYNGQNPGDGPSDTDPIKYYEVTGEHEIGLTLSGLSADITYDVASYRIDETHGNAYATWQGQGRPTMDEMSEDDWQALRDTMDSQPEPLATAVCGETFSHQFSLSSPGVYFVTLTPATAD